MTTTSWRILALATVVGSLTSFALRADGPAAQRAAAAAPNTAARVPVLVELFTSEGCSSCPPADDLLARIVEQQPVPNAEVIALGFHVDYWDRLGWRDQFSSQRYTLRQNDYARAWRSDDVFTPQAVVDGAHAFNGGDWEKARQFITQCASAPKLAVALDLPADAATAERPSLRVDIAPAAGLSAPIKGDVMIAVTQDNLVTNVQRGENAKKRLTHIAVVRSLDKLGRFDGQTPFTATRVMSINKDWPRNAVKIIVFVQDASTKKILGVTARTLTAVNPA